MAVSNFFWLGVDFAGLAVLAVKMYCSSTNCKINWAVQP